MVKIIKKQDKEVYKCEECGLSYEDKIWAEKCEKWCKKNHTCNVKIIKHSVKGKV